MQWLHYCLDQAKYFILDLAVLVLFCIGIVRIVRSEAERLRPPKRNQGRPAKPSAGPRNGNKNGIKPLRPREPTHKV